MPETTHNIKDDVERVSNVINAHMKDEEVTQADGDAAIEAACRLITHFLEGFGMIAKAMHKYARKVT